MRKIVEVSTLIVMIILLTTMTSNAIDVMVDNQYLEEKGVIVDGRTLTPMRAIFEALGMDVNWDSINKTAIAIKDDVEIKLKPDSVIARVNGNDIRLDVPAKIIKGSTYVPSRFVAENLGARVDWDSGSRTVLINSDRSNIVYKPKVARGNGYITVEDISKACADNYNLAVEKYTNPSLVDQHAIKTTKLEPYMTLDGKIIDPGEGIHYNIRGIIKEFTQRGEYGNIDLILEGYNGQDILYVAHLGQDGDMYWDFEQYCIDNLGKVVNLVVEDGEAWNNSIRLTNHKGYFEWATGY